MKTWHSLLSLFFFLRRTNIIKDDKHIFNWICRLCVRVYMLCAYKLSRKNTCYVTSFLRVRIFDDFPVGSRQERTVHYRYTGITRYNTFTHNVYNVYCFPNEILWSQWRVFDECKYFIFSGKRIKNRSVY